MRKLRIESIPTGYMLNAQLKDSVYLVKVGRSKDGGNCDIKPLLGGEYITISRDTLISDYTKLNGKKIHLAKLRGGKVYRVKGKPIKYLVMPLPRCLIEIADKIITVPYLGAKYLIENKGHRVVIGKKNFFQLFNILDEHKEAQEKLSNLSINARYIPVAQQNAAPRNHYLAIGKFIEHGRLQGFRLKNRNNGKTADFTLQGVRKLVAEGYVDNLVFSAGGRRSSYFRGNGITLSEIPRIRE